MAINFPASPADGDIHEGYVWVAAENAWRKRSPQLGDLSDIDASGVADGEALIYNSSTSKWEPGSAAPSGVKIITSDNINIDFSDNVPLETRAVAGDVTFTASNYTAGAKKTVYLEGDTVQRSLTFPAAWNFIADKPSNIVANAKNILDLNSFGTSESTTVALWLGTAAYDSIGATGGTESDVIVDGVTYRVHTFTSSGALVVTSLGADPTVEYLLVGGGGGGSGMPSGGSYHGASAGGGAGGFLDGTYSVSTSTFTINVGQGGSGGLNGALAAGGGNTTALGFSAIGGGYGGRGNSGVNGGSGGSGGGATREATTPGSGTAGQGFSGGGYGSSSGSAGGGGGASAAGSASGASGGNGGAGKASAITGNAVFYAAGGGGGGGGNPSSAGGAGGSSIGGNGGNNSTYGGSNNGTDALANTGSGGGGGGSRQDSGSTSSGGSGSDGIVIIRYPITDPN